VLAGWFYTLASGKLTLHKLTRAYDTAGTTENAEGPFFRGDDAAEVSAHIVESRDLVRERLAVLRADRPDQDLQPVAPATIACHRMTRRLVAAVSLTEQDAHRWFDDTIGLSGDWHRPGPVYAIPLRALCGVRHPNLLTVGRCISAQGRAWEALRAIAPCVVSGEAAGTAAALAAKEGEGNVSELDISALQDELRRQRVLLDRDLVTAA